MYDRITRKVHLFERGDRRVKTSSTSLDLSSDSLLLQSLLGEQLYSTLLRDIELLDTAYNTPDWDKIQVSEAAVAVVTVF